MLTFSEEKEFWEHGSMIYTNKSTWLKSCDSSEKYRIGDDIVACITKSQSGEPNDLVMSYAGDFIKSELTVMSNATVNPDLPLRSHSRFKCLRVTSGWMC